MNHWQKKDGWCVSTSFFWRKEKQKYLRSRHTYGDIIGDQNLSSSNRAVLLIKPNRNEKDLTMLPCDKKPCSTHPAQYKSSRVFICAQAVKMVASLWLMQCAEEVMGFSTFTHLLWVSERTHEKQDGFFWHRLWTSVLFEGTRFCTTFQSWRGASVI